MTHGEFPWKKARRGLLPEASSTEPNLLDDMKALGEQKLAQIERDHPAYKLAMSEVVQDAFTLKSSNRIGISLLRHYLATLPSP